MASSTLQTIQNKVRKLTRSPSINQLTDATLNEYINTFIAYDLPQELRLFKLHKTFDFVLSPFQDTYDLSTLTVDPNDPTNRKIIDPTNIDGD